MVGRTSAATVEAMKLVMAGVTPYKAMKRTGIAGSTMYRNRLYKLWLEHKDAQQVDTALANKLLADLREELDVTRVRVVQKKPTKREKFLVPRGESN